MRALAALLLIAVSTICAQTSSRRKSTAAATNANPLALPVLSVTVKGNQQFSAKAILAVAGVNVGDTATKDAFETARLKLVDTGLFDSVGYQYKPVPGTKPGYAAEFQVSEVKPLYKVQFAGLPGTDDEISKYLESRDPLYTGSVPPTQQIIKRLAGFLEEYNAAQKKPAKVIGKLEPIGPNDFVVQFRPDAPLPAVARVEFTGNEVIDEPTLQNSIGAVAFGLPYTERNFRELLDNQLRPMYEALGYMRVRFEDISTEPIPPPTKGLLVNVKIIEGAVYKLGSVKISAATKDERDELLHVAGLKPGGTVNFDAVNEAAAKVKKAVRRVGYFNAAVTVDRNIDDVNKKVDVLFKVDRGDKYIFGDLKINGLDLNGEDAVRKMWGKKPGDPYNPDYADHFLNEVKNAGIFDYLGPTHADAKLDETTHVVDVTLTFKAEAPKPAKKRPN
jgi:outer membrane protein assembly factor BamA